jgi:hypothetical protein
MVALIPGNTLGDAAVNATHPTASTPSPVERIPPSDQIRERLAELAFERDLLRKLLVLAVRREKDLAAAPLRGGGHAAP